jgi:hypothetical protein
MPVYDQSYRTYHGTLRHRGRWAVIVSQEIRVLLTRRMFIFLLLLGNFHLLARVLWIYVLDVVSKQPGGPFYDMFSQLQFENVGAWVYFDFLRFQSPLIFLTLIYAGSGLICNDFRNNLTDIYFSKPINWRDYVTGKVMALLSIGLSLTAAPALIMAGIHTLFDPTMAAVRDSLSNVLPILVFSVLMVGSFSLVILASSALTDNGKFAGVAVFLLTFVNAIAAGLIAELLRKVDYLAFAFPVSLNNLGEKLFDDTRFENPIDVDWYWSAGYIVAVCLIAIAIISRKARRAETGR